MEGHHTAATNAQSAGQTATSEDDLADTLLDDGNQSEWEARADFTRRLSMLPWDSFLELGMGNGAQAEWEARALWSLESGRASQEQPLHTFSSGLRAAGPWDPVTASDQLGSESNAASSQDDKDVPTGPDLEWVDSSDALDQAEAAVQQPLSAKAATAAALQRALSNIHFIATGSQQARAAAAAAAGAAAAAASPAGESDNATLLQPGSASLSDAHTAGVSLSEAAAGDGSHVLTTISTDVGVKAGSSLDSISVSTLLYSSSLADSANVSWPVSTLHDVETRLSVNDGTCQDVGGVAAELSGSAVEGVHHELDSQRQEPEVHLLMDTEQPQLGMEAVRSSAGQAANEQEADSGQQATNGQHVANQQQAANGQQAVYAMQPNNGLQADQDQQFQSLSVPSQLHMLGQSSFLPNQAASEQTADHSLQLQTRAVSQLDFLSENTADYEESRGNPAATGSQAVLDSQSLSLQGLLEPSLLEQQPQPEAQAGLSMAHQLPREGTQVQGASLQSQLNPSDIVTGQQGAVANQMTHGLSCTGSVQSDEHADGLHPAYFGPAATTRSSGGEDLLASESFAVPSWQGLPSFEPTSSVMKSMSMKQVNHPCSQQRS